MFIIRQDITTGTLKEALRFVVICLHSNICNQMTVMNVMHDWTGGSVKWVGFYRSGEMCVSGPRLGP